MRRLNRKFIATTFALLLVAFITTGCSIFELPVGAGAPIEPTAGNEDAMGLPLIQLVPETVLPGKIVTVFGENWAADELILISLDDPTDNVGPKGIYASATAFEDGSFVTSFNYPWITPWAQLNTVYVVAQNTELTDSASAVLSIAKLVEVEPPAVPPVAPPAVPIEPTKVVPTEPAPVPVPPARLEASVSTGALNMRTGPGVDFAVIKALSRGTSLTVLAQNPAGTWLKVKLPDGTTGWLSKAYTDFAGTAPAESGPAAPVVPTPVPTPVPPAPQPPAPVITEWRGAYFNNTNLSGTPTAVRNDYDVNFNWGGVPVAGIPADNFSVRWTRSLYFEQGLYRFHGWVDDGMRLYIDDNLVIDAWRDGSVREVTGERTLWAGFHDVRIEYYDHTGEGTIRVWWERITDQSDTAFPDWKAEYFDNRRLDGSPVVKRNETDIDHNWGSGSPGYGLPADNFSVRWTDRVRFKEGRYELKVTVDDGIRVWIDGDRIVDDWNEGSRTIRKNFNIDDTDNYDVKVEYYERWGNAEIDLSWERKGAVENEPVALFNAPNQVQEGSTAIVDGSPSYDTDGNIVRYQWDFNYYDSVFTVDAEGKVGNVYLPDGPATRRIALRVTDDDGLYSTLWRDVTVVNVAPRAEAGGPYSGRNGEAIVLAGSGSDPSSQDQGALSFRWDFGDGTQANGAQVSHVYAQAGSYTAQLTVTDKDGASGTDTTVVQVAAITNQPPTAVIQGPTKARVGETLNFGANASTDLDGNIVSYAWNFGDGTTASGVNVSHSYSQAGNFNVVLTVTDQAGASNTSTYTVVIESQPPVNQGPVAMINGPTSAKVGETVVFDSGNSSDPDGAIQSYIWDFGDSQSARSAAAESTVAHTYNTAGSYQVTLTVVDDDGLEATATHTIIINQPPPANQPPVAMINGPTSAKVGETVVFDSGNSADPDGTIVSYIWDFGDSQSARSAAAESTVAHTYNTAGSYQVTLTVVDDDGLEATATHTIIINQPPPANQPPVAMINGPTSAKVGETVVFDSGNSADPDGSIVSYIWDFGDGPAARNTTAESRVAHVYNTAGSYQVTLTVVDNGGLQATASHTIVIEQVQPTNQPPQAIIQGPPKAIVGETLTFNGGSSRDAEKNIVSYRWLFGDNTEASGLSVTHSYAAPGNYNVDLTVTDGGGLTDTTTYTVVVSDPVSRNPDVTLEPEPGPGLIQ